MKYILITLIILCSCTSNKDQQKDSDDINYQKIAKDLIQGSFDDLWAGVDSTKISKYHTDDFIILEHGEIWDNDRIKEFMRKQLARKDRPKRINKMDYISIDKYGESIQITYHNDAEFMYADTIYANASWLESALAVKTADGWRLKMMHSTRVNYAKVE